MSDTETAPETTTTPKRRRPRTKDPVLAGMFKFAEALDAADYNARRAAINWLAARYLDAAIIERTRPVNAKPPKGYWA